MRNEERVEGVEFIVCKLSVLINDSLANFTPYYLLPTPLYLFLYIVERLITGVLSHAFEFILDAHELVVLADAVGAAH